MVRTAKSAPYLGNVGLKEQASLVGSLQRSNEALARFAYICSHDLQEPVRNALNFSQKLRRHLDDAQLLDDRGETYLRFIEQGARHSRELIKDILAYSQIDYSAEEVTAVDVSETLNGVVEMLPPEDRSKISFDDGLPLVYATPQQLHQVFQNLISNALKYQKDASEAHVKIFARESGQTVEICIQDNGIGIPSESTDEIFTVFRRLHRRENYPGTGIGLSICQRIIERNNGRIWHSDAPGGGSIFHITLKKAEEEKRNVA